MAVVGACAQGTMTDRYHKGEGRLHRCLTGVCVGRGKEILGLPTSGDERKD